MPRPFGSSGQTVFSWISVTTSEMNLIHFGSRRSLACMPIDPYHFLNAIKAELIITSFSRVYLSTKWLSFLIPQYRQLAVQILLISIKPQSTILLPRHFSVKSNAAFWSFLQSSGSESPSKNLSSSSLNSDFWRIRSRFIMMVDWRAG